MNEDKNTEIVQASYIISMERKERKQFDLDRKMLLSQGFFSDVNSFYTIYTT